MMKRILSLALVAAMVPAPVWAAGREGSPAGNSPLATGGMGARGERPDGLALFVTKAARSPLFQGGASGVASRILSNRYQTFRDGATQGGSMFFGTGVVMLGWALYGLREPGSVKKGKLNTQYFALLGARFVSNIVAQAATYFIWAPAKNKQQQEEAQAKKSRVHQHGPYYHHHA